MKQDFLNYIKQTFNFGDSEMQSFEESLSKPLKKSIRVNTNKISTEDFKKIAESKGWKLTSTSLGKNTFYIDRFEDLDIALGNTLEHINGFFYIQELAASSSPFYMSGDKIDTNYYTILDMSASPGGKTTQLSEYYPNSLVIANEIDKQRLKGLFVNLDRMGSLNVASTNYDGRNFKNYEELFDKVLLDAPCSGEGTAYKTDDSLKYRNIKNIKSIQKLQLSLLDSAINCTKVGGEIVYSTCTLNTLENEEVVNAIMERYAGCLEIVPLQNINIISSKVKRSDEEINNDYIKSNVDNRKQIPPSWSEGQGYFIRNWPHINHTGGFFVAKIKKIKSIEIENNLKQKEVIQNFEKLSSREIKLIENYLVNTFGYHKKENRFYKYGNEIFMINKSLEDLWRKLFFFRIGVNIGELKNGNFEANFYVGTLEKFGKNNLEIDELTLDKIFKGEEIEISNNVISSVVERSVVKKNNALNINQDNSKEQIPPPWSEGQLSTIKDGYYQIYCKNGGVNSPAGLIKIKNSKAKSLITTKSMRK